jgi:hypothetical protein
VVVHGKTSLALRFPLFGSNALPFEEAEKARKDAGRALDPLKR